MKSRARLRATVAALMATVMLTQPTLATTWLRAQYVGGSTATPAALAMASSNAVGIAYTQIPDDFGPSRVNFRRSVDGGATWQPSVPISPAGVHALDAALSGRSGVFDVVWLQRDADGDLRVRYARSTDGGAHWTAKRTLSQAGVGAYPARVARDGAGRVVVVWVGSELGVGSKLYARVSLDGGTTFGSRRTVDATAGFSTLPNVTIGRNGKIHVAFYDGNQLVYRRSSDNGASWTTPAVLRTGLETLAAPAMASAGYEVVVGYTARNDDGDRWVAYRRSVDNGSHWRDARTLSSRAAKDTWELVLSIRSGLLRAQFARCGDTDPCSGSEIDLVIRQRTDEGDTWSAAEVVPTTGYDNPHPAGITGGANVVVAWMRNDGGRYLGAYSRRAN